MRITYVVLLYFIVLLLAYWANQQNYKTQKSIEQVEILQSKITKAKEDYNWLIAEWAYLNRPNRIESLADRYFSQLNLVPITAIRFGELDSIPFRNDVSIQFDQVSKLLIAVPLSLESEKR